MDLPAFEAALGHTFTNKKLAEEALTHASRPKEAPVLDRVANTRLAFLGDAVVGLAVRAVLYRDGRKTPGEMTIAAASRVSEESLAPVTKRLGLQGFMERGRSRPEAFDSTRMLAELYEAAIGAVFLDAGFGVAAALVKGHVFVAR